MSENWVDGTYESGADDEEPTDTESLTDEGSTGEDAGVELGLDQDGSSFEPEEAG